MTFRKRVRKFLVLKQKVRKYFGEESNEMKVRYLTSRFVNKLALVLAGFHEKLCRK